MKYVDLKLFHEVCLLCKWEALCVIRVPQGSPLPVSQGCSGDSGWLHILFPLHSKLFFSLPPSHFIDLFFILLPFCSQFQPVYKPDTALFHANIYSKQTTP